MSAAVAQTARWVTSAILLSVGAIVASAAHIAIDFGTKVYPPDVIGTMSVGVPAVALYVVWVMALVRVGRGDLAAARAAAVLALWQAGIANGAAALFPCPPTALVGGAAPCDLAPWQDFAHLGSLLFGFAAFAVLRRSAVAADQRLTRIAVVVLVVHLALALVVALV